jgi:hypothetical protein
MFRVRALLVLLLILLLTSLRSAALASAEEPRCRCATSDACYHYLHSPVPAPRDACSCPRCTEKARHTGADVIAGWNPDCWTSKDLDCFLKRHAASWRLNCSACMAVTDCCKTPHPEWCPQCGEDGKSPWKKDALNQINARLAVEKKRFNPRHAVAIVARHVYVVTDVPQAKVQCENGLRTLGTHEYAHLLAMRGEIAHREFSEKVGTPGTAVPVGVFVPGDERIAADVKAAYFRLARVPMIYSS